MARKRQPSANQPLPTTPAVYTPGNEAAARRQLELALNVIQSRLADIEAVVNEQQAAITDPTGGGTVDTQARTAIIAILDALRAHGLISS